jgi:hypothetical protein
MEIPNTDNWQPRSDATDNLKDIFFKRCLHVEQLILERSRRERQFNIDNFDSGSGLEDIIRDELSQILPERYFITKGTVNDRNGLTAGDQDIIIFNKFWFPFLKSGATKDSRKFHFPIEGIYAIGEIKQTLNFTTPDKAMKKLVICQRLERPGTGRTRITENRKLDGCMHDQTNPLYTFIIATDIEKNLSTDDIFQRFFNINKTLKRKEVVRALCVLQDSTFLWSYYDESHREWKPARFYGADLTKPILPAKCSIEKEVKSSFYFFMIDLLANLYNTILGAEDIAGAYGEYYDRFQRPPIEKYLLQPNN